MFEKASAKVIRRKFLDCYLSGPLSPRIFRPSYGPVLLLRKEMMPHEWVGCPLQIWATTGSSAEPGKDLIDDRIDKSQDEKACDCGTFFFPILGYSIFFFDGICYFLDTMFDTTSGCHFFPITTLLFFLKIIEEEEYWWVKVLWLKKITCMQI